MNKIKLLWITSLISKQNTNNLLIIFYVWYQAFHKPKIKIICIIHEYKYNIITKMLVIVTMIIVWF
jgi:hypothetical protein